MNVHSHPGGAAADAMAPGHPTREAILEAALGLFADRGFAGTSVPAVAERAGIAAGTIYRHFVSKEELVNAVYRRWKRTLMARLLDGFPLAAAPREQFHALWRRLADFVADHPVPFAFLELHHHAPYLDADSRTLELEALFPIYQLVDAARVAGLTKPLPAEALMALVWGGFVGMVKASRLGHLELTEQIVEGMETCLWDAVAAAPGEE